jgi:uncharacterized protein (TIGR02266 family)
VSDRRHERVPFSGLEVEFRTPGAFLVAYSTNLSKGGMFVETASPLPIGSEVTLRFTIPGESTMEVHGVVAWVQAWAAGDKPQGMGIRFEQLDERHGAVIDRIVAGFTGLRVVILSTHGHARTILARAVRSILATAEVVDTSDFDAAELALKQRPADLAVLDLDAEDPEMNDGLLALGIAKSSARSLPVIATAREEPMRARARELGADEVLANPPSLPDLQAAIVRVLARPARVR